MSIETLQDWNGRLAVGGCCVEPSIPNAIVVSRIKTKTFDKGFIGHSRIRFKDLEYTAELESENTVSVSNSSYERDTTTTITANASRKLHYEDDLIGGHYYYKQTIETTERRFPSITISETATDTIDTAFDSGNPPTLLGTRRVASNNPGVANPSADPIDIITDPYTKPNNLGSTLKFETDDSTTLYYHERTDDAIRDWDFIRATWTNPFGLKEVVEDLEEDLEDVEWGPASYPPDVYSQIDATLSSKQTGEKVISCSLRKTQYSFMVDNDFTGDYCKILYDIMEIPDEGDSFYISQDNEVEWYGPGFDIPWVDLDLPDDPGQRKIVNIRITEFFPNAWTNCGCCLMPICPEPSLVCESKSGNATCADDDYTDAIEEWEAGGEIGPEPEKPAGYDDYSYGCFLPFVEPLINPDDDIPTIYQREKGEGAKDTYSGQYSTQFNDYLVNTITAQVTAVSTFNSENFPERNTVSETTQWDSDLSSGGGLPGGVQSTYSSTNSNGNVDIRYWGLNDLGIEINQIEPTLKKIGLQTATANNGPIHIHQPTGPYAFKREIRNVGTREKYTSSSELSSGISKADLIARAEGKIPDEWDGSGGCVASFVLSWPTLLEARAALGGDWPLDGGGNDTLDSPPVSASITASRFRFRIPDTHTGSYFKITYDIAEFPDDEEVDPFFISQDNVVEWTGPGTGDKDDPSWLTDWVEIDPPYDPGERRVVNIRYTCYSGTKYGSKPQVMGEAFSPPEPDPEP